MSGWQDWSTLTFNVLNALAAVAAAVAAWKAWRTAQSFERLERQRSLAEPYELADGLISLLITTPSAEQELKQKMILLNTSLKRTGAAAPKALRSVFAEILQEVTEYIFLIGKGKSDAYNVSEIVRQQSTLRERIIDLRPKLQLACDAAISI